MADVLSCSVVEEMGVRRKTKMIDVYTKVALTVIAVCMVLICARDIRIVHGKLLEMGQ